MPDWIVVNMGVDSKVALRMLEKKWRLPVRAKRPAAVVAGATRGSVLLSKKRTMAYRYLHRVVYHFYERIGNTAVSTFASYVNEEEGRGTLRRVRGTQTQVRGGLRASRGGSLPRWRRLHYQGRAPCRAAARNGGRLPIVSCSPPFHRGRKHCGVAAGAGVPVGAPCGRDDEGAPAPEVVQWCGGVASQRPGSGRDHGRGGSGCEGDGESERRQCGGAA